MIKKNLIIIFFAFFITAAYSASTSSGSGEAEGNDGPPPAKNYTLGYKELKRAEKLDKKGKIEKAKLKYKKALKFLLEANAENPGNPDTLYYLGFTSAKLEKYDNAEIYYLLALEMEPNHIDVYKYLVQLYLATDRKAKAIEKLKIFKSCNCEEYDELKELIEKKG